MAQDIKFSVKSNVFDVLQAEKKQVERGLKAIGMKAETYAKKDCPVDTGRLRNSISNEVQGMAAYIGTNVEYAPIIEFKDMSHKVGKAHFLRDAASTHGDEYKEIMKASLKD